MKEIVKFPADTPVEVILQFEEGKHVDGRYGDQVMYSLVGDRVMYVPPYVEQRFKELAIGAGEALLLCKKQVKDGNRNRTEWNVKRAPQDAPTTGTIAPSSLDVSGEVGELDSGGAVAESEDEAAKQKEQPRGNSTALEARQSVETVCQHPPKDNAEQPATEVALASAEDSSVPLSAKQNLYLPVMSMEVALARRSAIVEFTRRIMVKDQDFGEIPGTNKPTLLKPGAEKLCNFFGLEPEFTPIVEDTDWTGARHGGEVFCYARYQCRLLREGRVVGVGEGSCNSWEAKYRYRWVPEDQVPEHLDRSLLPKRQTRRTLCEFDFAVDRAETTGTYGKPAEHWQRFRDAIRTGAARPVEKLTRRGKSVAWEIDVDTTLYRIANPDVPDVVNTIQKMAQKRALVAATLIATSASEFFTQDVEDADLLARNPDPGAHPAGTRQAQEYVRDRNLEELRPKYSAGSVQQDEVVKPWKNFGEMRRAFEQVREQVGETEYLEALALAGVSNPNQFHSASKALECYWSLARLASQPEVA